MKYMNIDSSPGDLIILNDSDNSQPPAPSLVQQKIIWINKLISKYGVPLFALLFFLLICLIVLPPPPPRIIYPQGVL